MVDSRFHELPNVFITPHSSGWTQAGTERRRIEEIATNLDALVTGEALINVVATKPAAKM
jgi:phosphoglycerate dehydrogenase-like enzyme|eukprot:COSAG06_NODE_5011_length_3792_cov_5.788248_2_plen_60_part_00